MSSRPRVLIVDPREPDREALAGLLPAGEAEVRFASTPDEALARLGDGGVALAILELDRAELDGYAVAARLRADEQGRELPLLFLTHAGFDPARIFDGFELGAVGFLSRPLDPRLLAAKVRTFLRLTRQRLELAEARRRLQTVMDALPVGISFSDDESCLRITGNRAALALFGGAPEGNLSASAVDPDATGRRIRYRIDGREIAAPELPLHRAVAEGRAIGPVEIEIEMPSGQRWHAETRGAPIRDEAGRVTGGVAVTVDVSARKLLEEALRESEARFRQTFENAAVGIAHIDFAGQFLRVNEAFCRLVGYARDELIGQRFVDITHPDDVADDVAFARRLGEGEIESFVREKRYLRRDGVTVWAAVTVSRAAEPTTGRGYAIAVVVDVAARRLAEQSRRELVSFVSHDLKSPLTALALQVGLARRATAAGAGAEERLGAALAQIERQVGRMGKLLDELLDAARLREGRPLDLSRATMDLVALVRPLAEELGANTPRHRVELALEAPALYGSWDARRLERVVQNLLSNAVKYSPAGGTVRVSLAREPGSDGEPTWAVLRVADEGVGIPAVDRSRIFDWFARGANVSSSRIEGSGIGLAAVREIVRQHGGSVSVESEEGRGSVFTVRLPLAEAG